MAKSNGKIVITLVENCYNCGGKICYNVQCYRVVKISHIFPEAAEGMKNWWCCCLQIRPKILVVLKDAY